MVQSIVVLSEGALSPGDAQRLVALHDPERPSFRVLVPVGGGHRNVLVAVLDYLSLLEPREAMEAAEGHPEPTSQQAAADVEASVASLKELGVEASGDVVDGDPLAAVEAAVGQGAEEVIVVTSPQAVEDTLHTNWASEARKRLGVPVLHLYAGSSWVGP